MTGDLILVGILVLGIVGLVALLRRTRRPDFASSELRRSTFEFLMAIGPLFGGRMRPPRPVPPAVTAPHDDESPIAQFDDRIDPPRSKPAASVREIGPAAGDDVPADRN